MKTAWLPAPLSIPQGLVGEGWRLRPLTVHDVVKDYDAVMSSRAQLWELFGPGSDWPLETLTLEQDLIDLAWHQKEFQLRTSFTYTLVSLDGERVLGCVYVMPPSPLATDRDADVYHWVRSSERASGLDVELTRRLAQWFADEWPFERVAYPGRSHPHTH